MKNHLKRLAMIVMEVVIILALAMVPAYFAYAIGEQAGKNAGYRECVEDTIFPTKSELDKLEAYFQ